MIGHGRHQVDAQTGRCLTCADGYIVVRDDDTLRTQLVEALYDAITADQAADVLLAVLRDVGTPATTETRRTATGPFLRTDVVETRQVTDWTEAEGPIPVTRSASPGRTGSGPQTGAQEAQP